LRTAALTLRAVPRLALALPPRLRRFTLLALIVAAALGGLYYGWFRDSSLVKVSDVSVSGLTGPDADRVRKRLTEAGLQMTTLHVREDDLRRAVESEPSIRAVHATPDFPHGLRIDVTENLPVAAVSIPGSGRVPLAGNGTLMPGLESKAPVPELRVQGQVRTGRNGTTAARIGDERVMRLVRVAAAAPPALLHRATSVEVRRGEGIVVVLRDGPRVMFGDDSRPAEKWHAAAGVLASKNAQGAAYVDVRLPDRPVAGGLLPQLPGPGTTGDTAEPAAVPPASAPETAPIPTDEAAALPAGTTPAAPSTPTAGSTDPAAPVAPTTPAPTPTTEAPAAP
jgi:cell division protein FtsQ